MHKPVFLLALLGLLFTPALAQAQDAAGEAMLSFGAGIYDVGDDDDAGDFRVEYRSGNPLIWIVKPWMGAELTSDGSVWVGGGVLFDVDLTEDLYIAPSFGVGFYDEGSSDLDLGYPIEFRSQIEGGYKFDSGQRVGVAFGHISNASLDEDNPGTEILNLYYHIPVNSLF